MGDETAVVISEDEARYTQLALANRTFGFWAGFLAITSTILFVHNIKLESDRIQSYTNDYKQPCTADVGFE
jgi:hypothetical protein